MTDLEQIKHRYIYMVRFSPEDDLWEIFFPDLPGLSTWVESKEEVGLEADRILTIWLEDLMESGTPLPSPASHPFSWPIEQRGTTEMVAKELGISERRVLQLAHERGLGHKVGRDFIFSPQDIEAMRERRPVGRPVKASTRAFTRRSA